MPVDATGIKRLIEEHKAIRANLDWLKTSINDTAALQKEFASTPGEIKDFRERMKNLGMILYYLKEGTENHIKNDEEVLNPIFGGKGLEDEQELHNNIFELLNTTEIQIQMAEYEKWNIEELRHYFYSMRDTISRLYDLVYEHTKHEDEKLRKVLGE